MVAFAGQLDISLHWSEPMRSWTFASALNHTPTGAADGL
jgi:hypothetical protein